MGKQICVTMETEATETRDNGDTNIRDLTEIYDSKYGGGRDSGLWIFRQMKNTGENQVDKYSGSRHTR